MLLALVFSTDNKPISQQRVPPLILKAVVLQPLTIPQKAESKPKLVNKTTADVEGGVNLKKAKKKKNLSTTSREKNETEASQALLEKDVSAQPLLKTQDVRPRVQDATKDYINRLNAQRLRDIAIQSPSTTNHSNVKRNPKLSTPSNAGNEDFLKSIEIVVDCSSIKGKLFSALSKNKGVTIEERDFPNLTGDTPKSAQGTVRCRDHKRFQTHIDKYLNKLQ